MERRGLLRGAIALPTIASAGSLLAAPAVRARAARVLRFVPQADLSVLDPILTTAYVARNHGMMVFDTLYGLDAQQRPQPQMAEAHEVDEAGLAWRFRLRDGLRSHDGEPVRARDCVASIRRWTARDPLGRLLLARLDDMAATDDRSFAIRLRRPFAPMLEAFAKIATPVCFIMPERLALTDPNRPVPEIIGSGPFRFLAEERVAGARAAYARFPDYRPRAEGVAEWTAGPKHAHFDRVEWLTMPDPATAVSALLRGEVDWWDQPTHDLLPLLRRNRDLEVALLNPAGSVSSCHFNTLHPPFDNPAIRRAILSAVDQAAFMTALAGTDHDNWRAGIGYWPPGTPLATNAGMAAITAPRDLEASRRALREAGYHDERVVILAATDFPVISSVAQVGADLFRRLGMTVDYQAVDFGTLLRRRASREPAERGGWSCFFTAWSALDWASPGVHQALRGGRQGYFGWADNPRMEALAEAWLEAPDLPAQRRIAEAMQILGFETVPFLPLGQYFQRTAWRRNLDGMLGGMPQFHNLRRV